MKGRTFGMKRNISILLTIALLAGMLTACGGEYINYAGKGDVSGSAVSGAAVTGQAVNEKMSSEKEGRKENQSTEVEKQTYPCHHTDTNYWNESMTVDGLATCHLDSSHKENIKIKDFLEFVTVANGYVYYVTYKESPSRSGTDILWRVPLKKDKKGYDKIEKEKAELLIKGEILCVHYVSQKFVLYEDTNFSLIKLDLKTKKKSSIWSFVGDNDLVYTYGNRIVLDNDEKLILFNEKENKWEKMNVIPDYFSCLWTVVSENSEDCFFAPDSGNEYNTLAECVYRLNFSKGKDELFVSKEQLYQVVRSAENLTKKQLDICGITDLFWVENRLYIQVQINWKQGKEYHMAYAMFSQSMEESILRYEKELTKSMRENRIEKEGTWIADNYDGEELARKESVFICPGKCIEMINGKAFLLCEDEKNTETELQAIVSYDLKNGKVSKMTRKDGAAFWEPAVYGKRESDIVEDSFYYDQDIAIAMKIEPRDFYELGNYIDGYFVEKE